MTRPWTIPLLAALTVAPGLAHANPTVVATLPTIAVANDSGVAEAVAPPVGSSTTRVTVEVATSPAKEVTTPAPVEPRPPAPTEYRPSQAERHAMQAHDDRKAGRALLAGGLTIAGAAYLFTSLAGAIAIDRARDFEDDPLTEADEGRRGDRRRAFGRALLVPGIGPAVAIHRSDSAVRAWGAGVGGLAQAVGAGLALLGTIRLARAHRLERMSVSAAGDARSAHVSLSVRF